MSRTVENSVNEKIRSGRLVILDGAMGTKLQAAGQKPGQNPEVFGMEHPEIVEKIHRDYVEAGSDVIYANTFGASRLKLQGTGHTPAEVIAANVATAKKAAAGRAEVALDMGSLGTLLQPLGTLSFDDAYDMFREQAVAGEEAGADRVIIETLTDLNEARAAVLAVKENTDLPVWVTMTFEKNGRTFLGTDVRAMALTLEGLGADAVGVNCSLGPKDLYPIVKELLEWTDLPVIVKPNAGLPDPKTGEYPLTPEEFREEMLPYLDLGIACAGGCCGSDEQFVAGLKGAADGHEGAARRAASHKTRHNGICSAGVVTETDGRIHMIGERINPTGKKKFQAAVRDHDMNYIMQIAIAEQEAGADVLDINVGVPNIDEAAAMTEVVRAVQSVTTLPLMIDSPNAEAVEAGLRAANGRCIVNSVNGEKEKQEQIFPLVKKYGAMVLGLAMDENGLPQTADQRVAIARGIIAAAAEYGIQKEDVMIDCLTLTVSAQQNQARETLNAVRRVREELGVHTVLGVSNISFGLPARNHVTESFLTQAMFAGLDFPIINPNEKRILDAVYSYRALSGEDEQCAAYISRFAEEDARIRAEKKAKKEAKEKGTTENGSQALTEEKNGKPEESRLRAAIYKGLPDEALAAVVDMMDAGTPGMDIINQEVIPALDVIGDRYETGEIFLPQMINSANAATKGLDYIKSQMQKSGAGGASKGKIIVATVEGDIHDIGKNIVKVVLENYGYQIIDLGRDVPVETVVETAVKEDVKLIGLSALMTTTVDSMKKTIEALRASGHDCRVMAGGAVLTEKYAMEIGADYYVADAKASVDVAKRVLG